MPLCENPVYIHEPTPLQCGQAAVVNRRRAIEHDRRDDDGVRPRIRQPARHGDFGQRQ